MNKNGPRRGLSAGALVTAVLVAPVFALAASLLVEFDSAWTGLRMAPHSVSLAAMALAIAASLVGLFLIRRRVVRPVGLLTAAIGRMAKGDFATPVPALRHPDEFSAMAATLEQLRRAESETQLLRQRSAQAIDSAEQAIVLFGADDRVVACNRSYLEMLRRTQPGTPAQASIIGLTYREVLALVYRHGVPGIPDEERDAFIAGRVAGHGTAGNDLTLELADGRWVHMTTRRTPDGGVIDVITDITNVKAAEAQQRALEAQLHHSQRLEALGTLAGGIAHDLNNTLVPILGLVELMAEGLPEDSPERESLAIVTEAALRAKGLVSQVLAFSRREQGQRRKLDFARLVREALVMLRRAVPSTIRIEQAIDDVPRIEGDEGQFDQVIVNLITNASQAIGNDIGTITVFLRAARGADGRAIARLTVRDTGRGMDEPTMARIFEPFFTTRPVSGGTGLGLSVVHGIIVAHGGSIRVTSKPGAGSTFEIDLPIADAKPQDGDEIGPAANRPAPNGPAANGPPANDPPANDPPANDPGPNDRATNGLRANGLRANGLRANGLPNGPLANDSPPAARASTTGQRQ
jgi:signal transduction histidine kinase/HAMP domain-containing protein